MGVRSAISATMMGIVAGVVGAPPDKAAPRDRVVEYAPGVRIDWPGRRVEVDGRTVLREGPLELFACSPRTREHESIVVTTGRPSKIYEGLGLIGLSPGHPIRQEENGGRWLAAMGDSMRIEVRWEEGGRLRTDDIGQWMRNSKTREAVRPMDWVFAGSYRDDAGTFVADEEGTVVCVVDFTSALVALPELHTADNEALWLEAYTERIPPVGTSVTVVFTPINPVKLQLVVDSSGRLTVDGRAATFASLMERIGELEARHGRLAVEVSRSPNAPQAAVDEVLAAVRKAVRASTTVELVGAPTVERPIDHPASNEDSGG
ncbi:MAG: hypothetical protein HOP29_13405 [Phycisphaerales bacterium]|nr:hypothetical protein [Phycisphaerales bacterium]